MLGCTATQVQENIVIRQLQIMFHTVRQCVRSVQRFASNESLSRDGTGVDRLRGSLDQVVDKDEK